MVKINIHPLTYFLLFSILICGYFNYFLIIIIIILIHDLGHIMAMKILKIKIFNIDILPFGSIIKSRIKYNLNSNYLLLISISGILMQLLLYLVFYILFKYLIINNLSYRIFLTYNRLIILFNLLPIIPLDGSKIFISFIERILPYNLSLYLTNIISIIFLIGFIFLNNININLVMISIFMFFKIYEDLINHKYIFYLFLVERYLDKKYYKHLKYINNIKNIYKNRYNFINMVNETSYLAYLIDK